MNHDDLKTKEFTSYDLICALLFIAVVNTLAILGVMGILIFERF